MAQMLPSEAAHYRAAAAIFAIEKGDGAVGLDLIARESHHLDASTTHRLLADAYTYLLDHPNAEVHLRALGLDEAAPREERGQAFYKLFQILAMQNQMADAAEVWDAALTMGVDPDLALPEMIRMQIYWYQYIVAETYVARDHIEARRMFYRTLIETKSSLPKGRQAWTWIEDYDPASLTVEFEEFAEAAMRFAAPDLALEVLMPRIEKQGLMLRPLLLAGFAFAQKRDLARAHWALGRALRLADLERPRRTRAGSGSDRIFSAEARITYGELPIDPDMRLHLDGYFMPKQQLH